MAISFYDEDGQFTSESNPAWVTTRTTTRLTSVVTAPSNTAAGIVWFYTESVGTIDNCTLVSTPAESNQQTYRKTQEATTYSNIGSYGGDTYPLLGFVFSGYETFQNYPSGVAGSFLIDGSERQTTDRFGDEWRDWEVRLGLAEGYLHVMTTIRKHNVDISFFLGSSSPPLPVDSPTQIWHDDSMEIYFNVGNESTASYDDNDFSRVYRFRDDYFYTPDTLTASIQN